MSLYLVVRPCSEGFCPWSEGRCRCPDPRVEVDVDELVAGELAAAVYGGTPEQRAEIAAYLES